MTELLQQKNQTTQKFNIQKKVGTVYAKSSRVRWSNSDWKYLT